jgi:hypothetical protein
MIEYIAEYTPGSKPSLAKRVTATSGEVFSFPLLPSNEEEVKNVRNSTVFEHINNLHSHMKEVFSRPESSVVGRDELLGSEPWPIKNLGIFQSSLQELADWWNIAYYRDEEENQLVEEGQSVEVEGGQLVDGEQDA